WGPALLAHPFRSEKWLVVLMLLYAGGAAYHFARRGTLAGIGAAMMVAGGALEGCLSPWLLIGLGLGLDENSVKTIVKAQTYSSVRFTVLLIFSTTAGLFIWSRTEFTDAARLVG